MKIKEQIDIQAQPSQVWPFLVDPVIQAAWNPKIISIDRAHDGPVTVGESFQMIAKMSGKESTSHVEVTEVLPDERLAFLHRVTGDTFEQVVTETFTLRPKANATRVSQVIDLSRTRLPWWVKPIIWLVMTFGKPMGEPPLAKLKQMIESELGSA